MQRSAGRIRAGFVCLLVCALLPCGVLSACVSSSLEHAAGVGHLLATADSSSYVAVTQPDGSGGVKFYSAALPTSAGDALLSTPFLLARTAAACAQTFVGGSYAPFFGKSVSLAGDVAAIGAPNRLDSVSGGGAAFSSIDVVSLSAFAAAAGVYSAAGVVFTTLEAPVQDLGQQVSLDPTGSSLASTYDEGRIAIFSPLLNRASSSIDQITANDTLLSMPSDFVMDSFSLRKGVLLVTGWQLVPSTGACTPWLRSYVFVPAAGATPNAWQLGDDQALLRTAGTSAAADFNSLSCPTSSAAAGGSLPLDLSTDSRHAVVGSPRQGCAFSVDVAFTSGNLQQLTVRARCADPLLYGARFGASVALTDPSSGGSSFVVTAQHVATTFSFAEWAATGAGALDPLTPGASTSFFQYPSRALPGANSAVDAGVSGSAGSRNAAVLTPRKIQAVAARSNMTVILSEPLADGLSSLSSAPALVALLSASAVPAGSAWNPLSRAVEPCPAGRYATGTGSGVSQCLLCPAGTSQPSAGSSACVPCGADSYCPTGSVSAALSISGLAASPFSSDAPYADVQLSGFGVDFDELLVSRVFSTTAYPAMIIFFVLTAIVLAVWIASFWADADGDEQTCCSSVGNCCLHSYRLLGRFKYFTLGRPGPFPYTPRGVEEQPDVIHYDARTGAPVKQEGVVRQSKSGVITTQVRNEDGSVTTTHTEALEAHAECASHSHRSPECEGYVTLVFILFALSSVCFTGMYLSSYAPSDAQGGRFQNVQRSRTEHAIQLPGLEPEFAAGVQALRRAPMQIEVALMGLSASQACSDELLLGLTWEGCTLPNSASSASAQGCATSAFAGAGWEAISASPTCVLSLSLPSGVLLAPSSSLRLTLPSSASFQALRLSAAFNSTAAIALQLPAQGTAGSSANEDNTAALGTSTFAETLYFSDANTREQRPLALLRRSWTVTPTAYRTQRENQWDDVYDTLWRAEVSDASSSPLLESQSPAEFLYGASSSSGDDAVAPAQGQAIQLDLHLSSSFTLRQTQRSMGGQAVLLWLIIGVVCVYHLFSFAELLMHVLLNALCRERFARHRRLRVAQTDTLPPDRQPTQIRLRPAPPPLEPLKPGERELTHEEHTQQQQYPQHLYPHQQSLHPADDASAWRGGLLPPLQSAAPPPFGFDARTAAGGRSFGGAGSLPLTPGSGAFMPQAHSSLEADRARYQAAVRVHRAASMSPQARAQYEQERIDIEMSQQARGSGFDL